MAYTRHFATAHSNSPHDSTVAGLFKRVTSPVSTCGFVLAGKDKGYTCDPITFPCCSRGGMCTFCWASDTCA